MPRLDTITRKHELREMHVTLSLEDEVVAEARVEAARAGMSLSRWIGRQIAVWLEEDEAAAEQNARPPAGGRRSEEPYPPKRPFKAKKPER